MRRLFWLMAAAAAVPFAGVMYQQLSERSDRRRYSSNGRLIRVGSSSIYTYDVSAGSEDAIVPNVTVLFESGIGATSQNWNVVQHATATHCRAVSYDRAGLGWSSARTCTPTPEHLAAELRALLTAAQIPGPYLLVAHSFGGLVARRFAAEYPGDVLGLVLVDPMRPTEWPPLSSAGTESIERGIQLARAGRITARIGLSRIFMRSTLLGSQRAAKFLCRIGGKHARDLMDRMLCEVGKMPREVWPAVVANWSRPEFYRTLESYLRSIPETVLSMHAAPPLNAPVAVLTPVSATPLSEAELQAISRRAREVLVQDSAHWVHLDQPEVVLNAIREMLSSVMSQPTC